MNYLYISFFLPPLGGAEPRHNLSVIRRLCARGYIPLAVTAPLDFDHPRDPALEALLPEGTRLRRVRWGGTKYGGRVREICGVPANPLGFGRWRRLYRAARDETRTGSPAFIYSVHGIGAAHLAALRLKRDTGLPWVAEFRDPWSQNAIAWRYMQDKSWRWWYRASLARTRSFTARVAKEADLIVVESPMHGDALVADFGAERDKVVSHGMGFEPDYFTDRAVDVVDLPRRPVIGYLGYVYYGHERVVGNFVAALRKLERNGVRFTLLTAGDGSGLFNRCALEAGLESYVPLGRLPLTTALSLMRQLDFGLVCRIPEDRCNINSKLWEYLQAGVSLLALVPPDGAMAALIEEGTCGYMLPYDADAMAGAISHAIEDFRAGTAKRASPDFVARYSSERIVDALASKIREIVGPR